MLDRFAVTAFVFVNVFAAFSSSTVAQVQFDDLGGQQLPSNRNWTHDIAVGDVDGDGDSDVVLARDWPYRNQLYLNDGNGVFTDHTGRLPRDGDASHAVVMGDVDGDGDLDLVIANGSSTQNRLYVNDGTGRFTDVTAAQMPPDTAETRSLAMGDVDGDGDADLIIGNAYSAKRLYLNDGAGTFTDATAGRMPGDSDVTMAIALGDLDGDGDLDLIIGNAAYPPQYETGQSRIYVNDGAGRFTDATATHMPNDRWTATESLVLGDVDGDGDLDAVFGNYGQANGLYLNDGAGRFTATFIPPDDWSLGVALGDVDGDGDLDLVSGNGERSASNAQLNRLYLNDGAGNFADVTTTRMPTDRHVDKAPVLADVDDDGDADLLTAGYSSTRLYLNLLRHVDMPLTASRGSEYRLEGYARNGPASSRDVAFPFVSSRRVRIPVPPIGVLGLDTTQMVPLPSFVIPQPAGMGSVSVVMPNDPNLVGITLFAQALIVNEPSFAYLSNVTADVVVR